MKRLPNELKQTEIRDPDIPTYGCWFMVLCALAWRKRGKAATHAEVMQIYHEALNEGAVITNEIPIGNRGWHRCWIADPERVANIALRVLGVHGVFRYLAKWDIANGDIRWRNPSYEPEVYDATDFAESVYGHFRVPFGYDPDPRLGSRAYRNLRVFSFTDYRQWTGSDKLTA